MCLRITSIVKSNVSIFGPFMWVMKSLVLLTVYSDVLRGDKSLVQYFASWYDAVWMSEKMNRIGSSSSTLSFFKLCIVAVPWNRAVSMPVGYNLLCSCSENLDFSFLKTFCEFLSVAAVESDEMLLNCFVFKMPQFFSIFSCV